jgi:hypothetical protein
MTECTECGNITPSLFNQLFQPTRMKKPISILMFSLASVATLPAAVTITVANFTPNGSASGGSGSGTGAISSSSGTMTSNRGMSVTTYTVTGVDLTSLGGSASESFTFTVGYTATSDGSTPGTAQFNGFGNVSVTGGNDNQVDGAETLTATIALVSTTFSNLSLSGLTSARAGGVGTTATGTFTWVGGSHNISQGNGTANDVTGNSVTLAVSSSTMNFEGFSAQFVAVPEPGSAT